MPATAETVERLRRDYTPPFLGYLARRDEQGLRAAYELGRSALTARISVLDLVTVHHAVFLDVVRTVPTTEEVVDLVPAAAAFLVEALAAYEMAQRGFLEAHGRGDVP